MLDQALDALAVARLTRLVVDDTILDGPRTRLLAWLDPPVDLLASDSDAPRAKRTVRRMTAGRKVAKGLDCSWCVSIWVAAGVVVGRRAFPRAWPLVAEGLAASEIAGMIADRS